MTNQRPELTDAAIEGALGRRAPHGPARDLLPAIVAQASGASQVRRLPFGSSGGPADRRQLARLAVAFAAVAALVGILVTGAGSRHEQLSVVPSGDPRASTAVAASPSPGPSASPAASPTDCTTDHIVIEQGADMPPTGVPPADLSVLGPLAAAYLISSDAPWTVGNETTIGGRYDLWSTDPDGAPAGATRRIAAVGGPGVDEGFIADVSAEQVLVIVGKISPSGANPECTDVYAIRTDGSGIARLSHAGQGHLVVGAAIAPDGGRVAYLETTFLPDEHRWAAAVHLRDLSGGEETVVALPCSISDYAAPIEWSASGDRIATACAGTIAVVDPSGQVPARELTFRGRPLGFAWTASDRLTVSWLSSSGPNIEAVDVATGIGPPAVAIDGSAIEWVDGQGMASFSPDGRWLLQFGGRVGTSPGADFEMVGYLVPATGGAPTQVLDARQAAVGWDAEGRLLYLDRTDPDTTTLAAVALDSGERTALAALDPSTGDWQLGASSAGAPGMPLP